jgi:histone deacetylase complex regulatory component SIN3
LLKKFLIGWKMENKTGYATQYITLVKKTYEDNPEVYRKFLKIMGAYKKKE